MSRELVSWQLVKTLIKTDNHTCDIKLSSLTCWTCVRQPVVIRTSAPCSDCIDWSVFCYAVSLVLRIKAVIALCSTKRLLCMLCLLRGTDCAQDVSLEVPPSLNRHRPSWFPCVFKQMLREFAIFQLPLHASHTAPPPHLKLRKLNPLL